MFPWTSEVNDSFLFAFSSTGTRPGMNSSGLSIIPRCPNAINYDTLFLSRFIVVLVVRFYSFFIRLFFGIWWLLSSENLHNSLLTTHTKHIRAREKEKHIKPSSARKLTHSPTHSLTHTHQCFSARSQSTTSVSPEYYKRTNRTRFRR